MAAHTWGVDKSHFDAPTGTAKLVAEGYGFLTHKAGGDADDTELAAWWADAKGHRDALLLGAYWVLYPGHAGSAGDAFVARLDSQCPGWRDGPFILQLDCEQWQGNPATKPGLGDIRACALRLRQLAPKLVPVVYAPRWAYGDELAGLGFPLWSSSYVAAAGSASAIYPGDSYAGWTPYSGITPAIAQFSSTAIAAGDTTTDVNCFKGTPAQLAALLAPGWKVNTVTTWSDPNVLAVNFFFSEAYRAMKGSAPAPGGGPDQNARNAQVYVRELVRDGTAGILSAVQGEPDADAIAAAVLAHLGSEPATDMAAALKAVLTPEQLADLVAALTVPAQPGEARGTDTPVFDSLAENDPDAYTRVMREQRQPDIQGGAE